MFERFTERARQVITIAQDEARALANAAIGPEHIALGLLGVPNALSRAVLEELGIKADAVRATLARGDEPVETPQIPFTPEARRVLELALREALSLGHNYIGSEHLLLGLVRRDNGALLGVEAARVRNEIVRRLSAVRRHPGQPVDLPRIFDVVEEEKERLIGAQQYEAAAALRGEQRRLREMLRGLEPLPGRWEYDVKTLEGASGTWVAQLEEWRTDGWELVSVAQEGGAVRAIVERRRRSVDP